MKLNILLFILSIFSAAKTWADTTAFFTGTGNKVIIILQGYGADTDAVKLSNALNVTAQEDASFANKTVEFTAADGTTPVAVSCKISKLVANLGSCTVTISRSANSNIRSDIKYASYILLDKNEAKRLSALFVVPASQSDVFESHDKNFKIPYYDPNGLGDFGMVYAQFH